MSVPWMPPTLPGSSKRASAGKLGLGVGHMKGRREISEAGAASKLLNLLTSGGKAASELMSCPGARAGQGGGRHRRSLGGGLNRGQGLLPPYPTETARKSAPRKGGRRLKTPSPSPYSHCLHVSPELVEE